MNCLIYPYSDELSSIVDNISFYPRNIAITKRVSLLAWKSGIENKEGVSFDFEEALDEVEGVIIADAPESKFMYHDTVKKIRTALSSKKNVICCTDLNDDDITEMNALAKFAGVNFEYIVSKVDAKSTARIFQRQDCIVMAVGGILEGLDSVTILTNLVHRYRKMGYRVTAVSDNKNTALLNFVPFPLEILNSSQAHDEIIKGLNTYYNNLQLQYQPDIIITQIPNGLVKYSNLCVENFGVKAYMLSQALSVDYFILTSPMDSFDDKSFDYMSTTFKYRFGFEIDAVGVVNRYINSGDSRESESIVYNKASLEEADEFVDGLNSYPDNKIMFFNVYDTESYDKLANKSINTLSGQAEED